MSEEEFKDAYLEKHPKYRKAPWSAYDSDYFNKLIRWKGLKKNISKKEE